MLQRRFAGWLTGLVLTCGSVCGAADVIVQDFDGWKITIRPGASSDDPAPRSPLPTLSAQPRPLETGSPARVQLATLRQLDDATPPPPAPMPGSDELPRILPGEPQETQPVVMPPEGTVDPRYLSQMYSEIYRSIPFIRAEYHANPSYLHDTTVEFLFGKMRPTVIHRGTTHVVHQMSPYDVPWGFGSLPYAYPRLNLVVPGVGLRIHRE